MRSLRFGYWWMAGGLLLVGMVLYTTLTPAGGGAAYINDKFAHFLAFVALMGWFSGVVRSGWFPLLALLLVGFGIGIELLQSQLTYRSAEIADALFDFAGILVAWIVAAAGLDRWAEFVEARLLTRDT
jgi:VanZ family protein